MSYYYYCIWVSVTGQNYIVIDEYHSVQQAVEPIIYLNDIVSLFMISYNKTSNLNELKYIYHCMKFKI